MEKRERHRNCADKLRARFLASKIRQWRELDPAITAILGILSLVSSCVTLFTTKPSLKGSTLPLPPSPRLLPHRTSVSKSRYTYHPSWATLLRDVTRPAAHDEARKLIYARLPVAVHDSLNRVFEEEDWSVLRPLAHPRATDEEVSVRIVSLFQDRLAEEKTRKGSRRKNSKSGGSRNVKQAQPDC